MEFTTIVIAVLIIGLAAAMTADVILDMETIWNAVAISSRLDDDHRGSGRDEKPPTKANLSWVQMVEDEAEIPEIDIIALAKSRAKSKPKSKPVVQAGIKVRALLDSLGKQLVDYSALTIRELKAIAKERRLPKYGSLRKAELIAALQSS